MLYIKNVDTGVIDVIADNLQVPNNMVLVSESDYRKQVIKRYLKIIKNENRK